MSHPPARLLCPSLTHVGYDSAQWHVARDRLRSAKHRPWHTDDALHNTRQHAKHSTSCQLHLILHLSSTGALGSSYGRTAESSHHASHTPYTPITMCPCIRQRTHSTALCTHLILLATITAAGIFAAAIWTIWWATALTCECCLHVSAAGPRV